MRRPQHNKIGNVHLKWAFSEGAVLFLRNNERGQRWHDKRVQRYGKAKVRFAIEFCALFYKQKFTKLTMSIIAQKLGRTVYYMLKRREAFNPDKFYGNKKIENKDSGGEHLAYVASRRLHERKLFKSPLSRLVHN